MSAESSVLAEGGLCLCGVPLRLSPCRKMKIRTMFLYYTYVLYIYVKSRGARAQQQDPPHACLRHVCMCTQQMPLIPLPTFVCLSVPKSLCLCLALSPSPLPCLSLSSPSRSCSPLPAGAHACSYACTHTNIHSHVTQGSQGHDNKPAARRSMTGTPGSVREPK
jgi:hypothetical protein